MKKSRLILIGSVIVGAIALLTFGLNYLKGQNFFKPQNNYFVEYQKVDGIVVSDPVLINGYRVGQIRDMTLQMNKPEKSILVELDIDNDIKLNDASIARIYSTDMLGSKGINLIINNGTKTLEQGDFLIAEIEKSLTEQVSSEILPIKQKVETLMEGINSSLGNLDSTFINLEHASHELDMLLTNSQSTIQNILFNVNSISKNLKENNEKINLILSNFASISDSIAKSNFTRVINNASSTLAQTDSIMQRINRGESSIGKLVNDEALYNNLEQASKDLDNLLIDIKSNPKRYISLSVFDFSKPCDKKKKK